MTMLTPRELDLLASLRSRWRELYLSEITRLMKEDDTEARTVNQAPTQTISELSPKSSDAERKKLQA